MILCTFFIGYAKYINKIEIVDENELLTHQGT